MPGVEMEADLGIVEAGFHFSIHDVESAIHSGLKKHGESRPRPSYLRRSNALLADGTHIVTLDVGSPPTGRMWQVIGITLFGTDDHTAVATVVGAVYIGNANQLSLSSMVVPNLVFPSYQQLSDKVLWVHPNENLCVQTSVAGTAGQQYGVNFSILEWRDHEISQRFGR
jgi:hypothetical protein